jgi:hypothetical protein
MLTHPKYPFQRRRTPSYLSRDSSVGIVSGWSALGSIPDKATYFSLLDSLHTGSYPKGTGGSFPGGKATGP